MEGVKQCYGCGETKPLSDFPRQGRFEDGSVRRKGHCKPCYVIHMRDYYRRKPEKYERLKERARERAQEDPAHHMWIRVRLRARKSGIEFSIQESDLRPVPERCPVLGIPLVYSGKGANRPNMASLDRVDNTKGYVPGNVRIISFRANELKSNATLDELRAVLAYFEDHTAVQDLIG